MFSMLPNPINTKVMRIKAMELAMNYLNEHLENELDLIQVAAEIYTFIQGETK